MLKKVFYWIKKQIAKKNRKYICRYNHPDEISLITCNCIGGLVYSDINMRFCSPTINLYIPSPDFVKFTLNLKYYLDCSLEVIDDTKYPICKLGDITIHFLHYDSFEQAKQKWNERKKRIVWDKIFVIMSDRDSFSATLLEEYKKIPYPKILYSHLNYDVDGCIWVSRDRNKKYVDDLTKFYNLKGEKTYEHYFDIEKWITGLYDAKDCIK